MARLLSDLGSRSAMAPAATPTTYSGRHSPVELAVEVNGNPVPPVVLVDSGVFRGRRWEYLAYHTDKGRVCGQLVEPEVLAQTMRGVTPAVRARMTVTIDGHTMYRSGSCGFTFGTSGFYANNRAATNFEAMLPASYARVRIEISGRPAVDGEPVGRRQLGRGLLVLRLDDLRSVRSMTAWDDKGRLLYRGTAAFSTQGLDFRPRGAP